MTLLRLTVERVELLGVIVFRLKSRRSHAPLVEDTFVLRFDSTVALEELFLLDRQNFGKREIVVVEVVSNVEDVLQHHVGRIM